MSDFLPAPYAPAPAQPASVGFDPTGGRLVSWASGLAAAHQIGTALCGTAFAPAQFRGKPDEAAAAILYGDEIGLTPTQALQSVHVISGKPGLYARAMVALVMSKGHEVWTVEETPAKVTVAGRRKGTQHVEQVTWTMDRARKAGYTSNKKYDQNPEDMLYARAAATVCRRIAPDALAGLAYAVEELELDDAPASVTVTRTAQPSTRAQRKPKPEPAAPEEPPLEEPPLELRSDAQMRRLWALAKENGLDEVGFRAFISDATGREVESTKSLTATEAHRLIEELEAPTATEIPQDAEAS